MPLNVRVVNENPASWKDFLDGLVKSRVPVEEIMTLKDTVIKIKDEEAFTNVESLYETRSYTEEEINEAIEIMTMIP